MPSARHPRLSSLEPLCYGGNPCSATAELCGLRQAVWVSEPSSSSAERRDCATFKGHQPAKHFTLRQRWPLTPLLQGSVQSPPSRPRDPGKLGDLCLLPPAPRRPRQPRAGSVAASQCGSALGEPRRTSARPGPREAEPAQPALLSAGGRLPSVKWGRKAVTELAAGGTEAAEVRSEHGPVQSRQRLHRHLPPEAGAETGRRGLRGATFPATPALQREDSSRA